MILSNVEHDASNLQGIKGKNVFLHFFTLCLDKIPLLLLAFSSVVSNTGTLILAIIILLEYSWIYTLIVVLFNFFICYFLKPSSYVSFMQRNFDVVFKCEEEEKQGDKQRIKQSKLERALYLAYGNIFTMVKPVEDSTHLRYSHTILLQMGRFILNLVTLIYLMASLWSPLSTFNRREALTGIALAAFVSGILNVILLIHYFYLPKPRTNKNYFGMILSLYQHVLQ